MGEDKKLNYGNSPPMKGAVREVRAGRGIWQGRRARLGIYTYIYRATRTIGVNAAKVVKGAKKEPSQEPCRSFSTVNRGD